MYTQCSNCNTVFQISAEVLRAAGGQVRCGRCGQIFSALSRLAEEANSFESGESAFDMEARADSILESVVAEQVAQALPDNSEDSSSDGTEIAQLEILNFTEEDMEFTLPPDELDRIFIERKPGHPAATSPSAALSPVAEHHGAELISLAPAGDMTSSLQSSTASTATSEEPVPDAKAGAPAVPEDPLPHIEVISDDRTPHAMTGSFAPTEYAAHAKPEKSAVSIAAWLGIAIFFALLLTGQIMHRESPAGHGFFESVVAAITDIRSPSNATPNLAAYELRQWGVTGDTGMSRTGGGSSASPASAASAASAATLHVRATILNASAMPQPFPLLRVTLANRYGAHIGARDFEPGEYTGTTIARQLSAGEMVDVMLNILDPGKDAEGFEIDVCLRLADGNIRCANDTLNGRTKP